MKSKQSNDVTLLLIIRNFLTNYGGNQTYFYNICKYWKSKKTILCTQSDEMETKKLGNIKVIENKNIAEYGFANINKLFSYCFIYYKESFIKSLILFVLLIINRSVLKSILPRLETFCQSIPIKRNQVSVNSLVLPEGVIGLFLKIKFNIPLIILFQGSELHSSTRKFNEKLLLKFVLKNSDLLIANSAFMKDLVVSICNCEDKVKTLNLGADTNTFYPYTGDNFVRNKFNVKPEDKLILSISHLVPTKGVDTLIKSLVLVKKEIPNAKYLIIGHGEEESKLLELVRISKLEDTVMFAGFVPYIDLNKYINSCDVLILPSRQEGFGLVLIEANACMKPVIGAKVGGIIDAVIDNVTGLLFEPDSVKDLARKIIKMLQDEELASQLAKNGYNRVLNELNWEIVIDRLQSLIKGV